MEDEKPKRRHGRPEAQIDVDELEKLAALHCTHEEIASFFGCNKRTLTRYLDPENKDPKYREAWERGRQRGKTSLRRLQWHHANGTGASAVTMTIHLSKHWLGETEKSLVEHTGAGGGPVATVNLTPEKALEEARKRGLPTDIFQR